MREDTRLRRTLIVLPCFNEAHRINTDSYHRFLDKEKDIDFLFVDDGSTDDTPRLLDSFGQEHPRRVSVLHLRKNRGKAEAVRQGFLQGFTRPAAFIGFWDADLATPLESIPEFLSVLENKRHIEMVSGARVGLLGRAIERNMLRHYLGRISATMISRTLKIPVYDTQCGAKLFRRSKMIEQLFQEPFLSKWIFDVEIIARLIRLSQGSAMPPPENLIYEYPLERWADREGSQVRAKSYFFSFIDLIRIYFAYLRK